MSTPMSIRILQRKIKVQKAQCLLMKMNEPVSRAELEKRDKVNPNNYQQLFNLLRDEGLIVRAGDRGKERLWQATKQVIKQTEPSLADPHFVYNADKFQEKHIETSRQTRLERKSTRVWVSGAQAYA